MLKSYRGWIGSQSFDTKAKTASEAKRNIAHAYRTRGKYWGKSIASIIKKIKLD